jgi:hypothetical protein
LCLQFLKKTEVEKKLNSKIMEIIDFNDMLNKCRCCFQFIDCDIDKVDISSGQENDFFQLTKVELLQDENYSSIFCISCDENLKQSVHFMSQAKERQILLYESFSRPLDARSEHDYDQIEKSSLKSDLKDQSVEFEGFEELHKEIPIFQIKSENFDIIPTPRVVKITRTIQLPSRYRSNFEESTSPSSKKLKKDEIVRKLFQSY